MKDMNTVKFVINWQNFARVRLQLKFAFILWPNGCLAEWHHCYNV